MLGGAELATGRAIMKVGGESTTSAHRGTRSSGKWYWVRVQTFARAIDAARRTKSWRFLTASWLSGRWTGVKHPSPLPPNRARNSWVIESESGIAQTPVMNLYEELTAQLGGPSGTAVAVPRISSYDLAAQRTPHHKNAEVFVGADGHINSIRIGARGSSTKTGTFLRIYDKPSSITTSSWASAPRSRSVAPGNLATTNEIDNPFSKFGIYQFPPATNQGLFGCFVSAVREKGPKRALAMLSDDKARPAEFQAILDQCRPLVGPRPALGQGLVLTRQWFGA